MKNRDRRQMLKAMAAATSAVCLGPVYAQSQNKPKIAFMLHVFATDSDVGWDYEHVRAIEQARAVFGERAQIDIVQEPGEWGNGDKQTLERLVADGYDMIFTTSHGFMKSTVEVAQANPNIIFEHCTGYIRAENIATYNIRWHEGRAVEGFLAATMSESNRIGYLGAYPIPEVIVGINATYLAARAVNPKIEFEIVWLNDWHNYDKEAEVARQLVNRGADVLLQHTGSTAAAELAQDKGIYSFGQHSDMSQYGPDAVMSSMVNNWGPYYVQRIGEFLDGTWVTQDTWGGLGKNMVAMAPLLETLPNRAVLQTRDVIDRLSSGEAHAFVGPIRKQDGSGWLAPGETASDSDLLTMDFYVEGIASVYPSQD